MIVDLSGRTALVTGSGRNLGKAIALAFARMGANVVVNSRATKSDVDAVVDEIAAAGGKGFAVVADVSTPEGARHLISRGVEQFGVIHILVNVVGISPRVPVLEMTERDWRQVFAVNIDSVFFCTQAALHGMVQSGWGRIINVTGHAHLRGDPGRSHVAATKAAVVGFSHSLAREVAPCGILVNVVAPGSFDTTERVRYYRDLGEGHKDRHDMMHMVALNRLGDPREFANVCLFLASDASSFITGQTILVNGGMYMT